MASMDQDDRTSSELIGQVFQEFDFEGNSEETIWLEQLYKHCVSLGTPHMSGVLLSCVRELLCHVNKKELCSFTPVTISDLKKNGSDPRHSDLQVEVFSDIPTSSTDYLHNSRLILIACVTTPSNTNSCNRDGSLIVKDCEDYLTCQIRGEDSEHIQGLMDSLVIFPKWNLISSEKAKVLEICYPPVQLEQSSNVGKKNIQVLNVEDADFLLNNKETLNPGLVNVFGTVTAVSEIFSVKNDRILLIKLADMVNIIIKKGEYLHWQMLLIPQKEYVFTNLKPTTLQKGGSTNIRLYVPWDKSSVMPKEKCECFFLSAQEWLSDQKQPFPKTVPPNPESVAERLFCYQGKITNTDSAQDGILEMDHKVRLYLCCIPPSDNLETLRLGTRITVYNVHRRGSVKPPKINLICCMMSCIKITEFSTLRCQHVKLQYSAYLQRLVYRRGVNFSQLSYLLDLIQRLRAKIYPTYIRNTERVMMSLLKQQHPCWFESRGRNMLMEFLSQQHTCLMTRKEEVVDALHFPAIANVGMIQDFHSSTFDANGISQIENDKLSNLNEQLYWLHLEEENDNKGQILIGCLQLSDLTGHLQLADKTGAVDIVCGRTSDCHACDKTCHVGQQTLMSHYSCPFVQLSSLGQVIAIHNYKIVRERFMISNFPTSQQIGQSQYVLRTRFCVYVHFSMQNCYLLGSSTSHSLKYSTSIEIPGQASGVKRNLASRTEGRVSSSTLHSSNHLLYVTCKEPVVLKSRMNCHSKLRFCATAYIFDEAYLHSTNKKKTKFAVMPELINETDSCVIVDEQPNPQSSKSSNQVTNKCRAEKDCENRIEKYLKEISTSAEKPYKQSVRLGDSTSDNNENCNKLGNESCSESFLPRGKNDHSMKCVVLLFQGSAVKWYDVLWPGYVYRLYCPNGDVDLFRPKISSWQLKRAVMKSNMKTCILLPDDVEVKEILTQESLPPQLRDELKTSQSQILPMLTVSKVLSSSSSSLVSFQGQIISRSHCEPESVRKEKIVSKLSDVTQVANELYGLSTLDNKVIKLVVQDCESASPAEISVYLNLENISYPLGLIPGAVVDFRSLEKKMSKIGRTYCSFIAVSSVKVIHLFKCLEIGRGRTFADIDAVATTKLVKRDMDSDPLLYLSQLWNNTVNTFRAICQVQQISKLSLKSVCDNCGGVFGTAGCTVGACSKQLGRFLARASVIVDDGTGVAMVTCSGLMVQHLLQLSNSQWQSLEDSVKDHGQIFITQNPACLANDLEVFLHRLCESVSVKKTWMMHLGLAYIGKHSEQKSVYSQLNINTMNLEGKSVTVTFSKVVR